MVSNPSNLGLSAGLASSSPLTGTGGLPLNAQVAPSPVATNLFADLGQFNYSALAGSSGNLFSLLNFADNIGTPNPLAAPQNSLGQTPVLTQTAIANPTSPLNQMSTQLNAIVGALSQLMGGGSTVNGAGPQRLLSSPASPSPGTPTNPLVSNAATPGGTGLTADTGQLAPGNRPLRIAQIDDFTTDNTGFNHGQEVGKTLNPDGSTSLLQLNIGGGGDRLANISNALDTVLARVQRGETIDAVNLSQQDFGNGPEAAQIRAKIDAISALGVPVAVAAGNNGPNQKNDLVSSRAFSVGSTTNGQLNPDSGIGNVTAEGRTTSFATANFARQIAMRHAEGLNVTA